MMIKSIIDTLNSNLGENDFIDPSRKILSSLHSFNYLFSSPENDSRYKLEYTYFWCNLFENIFKYHLNDLLDLNLKSILLQTLENTLKDSPSILLKEKIMEYLESLNLNINTQDYLNNYYQTVNFSELSESTINEQLKDLTNLYQQDKINEYTFGIIFSRIPNYSSFSPITFKLLKDIFYIVKEQCHKKYQNNFLKEYLGQENMSIQLFNFKNEYFPARCHPHNGRFNQFLDGSKDKPTRLGDRKPLESHNFDRKRKNESYFFYNFEYGDKKMSSIWRTQMIYLSNYFKFICQVSPNKMSHTIATPKKKRGREKFDPKKELSFHKNCKFKPKKGKRTRTEVYKW